MWKIRLVLAATAMLTLLTASPSEADLLVNGSFETPIIPAGGFIDYVGGSTALTGWSVSGVDVNTVSGTFTQDGIVFEAEDGKQLMDLSGYTSNSSSNGISQTVTTVIGQSYSLSFYVGSATDHYLFDASTVDLSIGGGTLTSYTNSTTPSNMVDWKLFTVNFAATDTMTSIAFFDGSGPSNYESLLDNVSLNAVPEPSAVILVSLGVVGIMMRTAFRRLRR